jgi:hypothetical protein
MAWTGTTVTSPFLDFSITNIVVALGGYISTVATSFMRFRCHPNETNQVGFSMYIVD